MRSFQEIHAKFKELQKKQNLKEMKASEKKFVEDISRYMESETGAFSLNSNEWYNRLENELEWVKAKRFYEDGLNTAIVFSVLGGLLVIFGFLISDSWYVIQIGTEQWRSASQSEVLFIRWFLAGTGIFTILFFWASHWWFHCRKNAQYPKPKTA